MKILAVCGFGVGSSMVLKMTADRVLKELDLEGEVENTDIGSVTDGEADLILTSMELAENLRSKVKTPVYGIKKYMDNNEVKSAIERYLEEK